MENSKTTWIIVGIIALFLLFVVPWGGGRWGGACGMMGNYYSSGSYGWGMMSGGFGFGWLFMILVAVALVLLIVWLAQQLQHKGGKR